MKKTRPRIHILGIGGVGLGGLAGLLKEKGFVITGSEAGKVYPPMSQILEKLNFFVFKGFSPENIEKAQPELVIIGNVIRKNNPEALVIIQNHLPYLSMPEALKYFVIKNKKSLVVTGTHGKTTTSALLAYALEKLKVDPTFLVGGLLQDRDCNFRLGQGPYVVLEGDEYDSAFFDKRPKFIHYAPYGAILTSIEFDHADIYPAFSTLKQAFQNFVKLIPPQGFLVYTADSPDVKEVALKATCTTLSYGYNQEAQVRLEKRKPSSYGQHVYLIFEGKSYDFFLPLIGRYNALNALAVWGVLSKLGFSPQDIAWAMADFPGTRRRQEILHRKKITIIDDFAHHPTAVQVTIEAVRESFSPKRLIVCFEPRTNTSRRNIFQKEYVEALSQADLVFLKEPPDIEKVPLEERLNIKKLSQDLCSLGTKAFFFSEAEEFLHILKKTIQEEDTILFMSNGPFDKLPDRLVKLLCLA